MFGHERGDDHVTRAFDAMDRGHGIDGDGQREPRVERETGERCGRLRAESEHERVAEPKPKPKTPDVDLGMSRPPSRFRSNNAGYASRELPQSTLHPPGGC